MRLGLNQALMPRHFPTRADWPLAFTVIVYLNGCIRSRLFAGGYSGGVPPVPIPNTEVKPTSADDTAWETVWESRSSPDLQ